MHCNLTFEVMSELLKKAFDEKMLNINEYNDTPFNSIDHFYLSH